MPEITLEVARQYVKDITGIEVFPVHEEHALNVYDYYRLRRHGRSGDEQTVDEAWKLQEALVHAHFDRLKVTEERDLLKGQLAAIEKQRAKWRRTKRKSRALVNNPLRHDPRQESIYGDGHVAELTEEITPR
jgi:hypothetical protein